MEGGPFGGWKDCKVATLRSQLERIWSSAPALHAFEGVTW